MQLTIKRRYFDHGTFGDLFMFDKLICVTVEREWNNNLPFVSCVPEGRYKLVPHNSPKYDKCFALVAPSLGVTVNGPSLRTHCLLHIANRPDQLAGCVAPGINFGVTSGQWSVMNSTQAFNDLIELLGEEEHDLEITRA
jgi:hypothetical protein